MSVIPCHRGGHHCVWPTCSEDCDGRPGTAVLDQMVQSLRDRGDKLCSDAAAEIEHLAQINGINEEVIDELRKLLGLGETENERLERENTKLQGKLKSLFDLVRDAYNDGFTEGMREHTSRRGGKPWTESNSLRKRDFIM